MGVGVVDVSTVREVCKLLCRMTGVCAWAWVVGRGRWWGEGHCACCFTCTHTTRYGTGTNPNVTRCVVHQNGAPAAIVGKACVEIRCHPSATVLPSIRLWLMKNAVVVGASKKVWSSATLATTARAPTTPHDSTRASNWDSRRGGVELRW